MRPALLSVLGNTLVVGALAGCGIPGAPQPPSLNLPQMLETLTAQRIGDSVVLHWVSPTQNTDKTAIRSGGTVRICRMDAPGRECRPAGRSTWQPGAAEEFVESPPQEQREGAARAIYYEVEEENAKGRSAGFSQAVAVAAGVSAPSATGLTALNSAKGVELRWKSPTSPEPDTVYRIHRERLPPEAPADPAGGKAGHRRDEVAQVLEVTPDASENTGALDSHVEWGERYRYQVQSVRKVRLEDGGVVKAFELLGAMSNSAEVETKNVFPPKAPAGLEAVPVWVNESGNGAPGVDLNWEPNSEPNVAGYRVYRTSKMAGRSLEQRILISGSGLLNSPAFEDRGLQAGVQYSYAVVAVDASGNVSEEAHTGVVTALASEN